MAWAKFVVCACHDSTFDTEDGGEVIDGQAPRMLRALAIKVVENQLVVAGSSTARI